MERETFLPGSGQQVAAEVAALMRENAELATALHRAEVALEQAQQRADALEEEAEAIRLTTDAERLFIREYAADLRARVDHERAEGTRILADRTIRNASELRKTLEDLETMFARSDDRP